MAGKKEKGRVDPTVSLIIGVCYGFAVGFWYKQKLVEAENKERLQIQNEMELRRRVWVLEDAMRKEELIPDLEPVVVKTEGPLSHGR